MSLSHLIKLSNFLLFPDFLKDLVLNQVCLNQVLNKVHILHLVITSFETLLSQTFLLPLPLMYPSPFFWLFICWRIFPEECSTLCLADYFFMVSCSFIPRISSKLVIGARALIILRFVLGGFVLLFLLF